MLQYFTGKENCFFDFLAFFKSLNSIWPIIAAELLHEIFWFSFDFIGIFSKYPGKILGCFCKKSVGTLYYFFLKVQRWHFGWIARVF